MQPVVLFLKTPRVYLIGDPDAPEPWIGSNPDALAALHRIVSSAGAWCDVQAFGGSCNRSALHQRLHNAARGLEHVSPLLAGELRRGLTSKRNIDGRILWRYNPRGALAFIETRA